MYVNNTNRIASIIANEISFLYIKRLLDMYDIYKLSNKRKIIYVCKIIELVIVILCVKICVNNAIMIKVKING